jgi:hypothetical protein
MVAFVINGYTIGQDIQVSLQDDAGNFVADVGQLGHLMEFEATQEDTELRIIPITNGGVPLIDTLPHGWTGRMTFTRINGALDNLWAAIQNNFYAGRRQHFQIGVSVVNRDGTTDTYTFIQVSFSKPSFGNFRADKEVDQTVTFRSQNMINTSGVLPPVGF